LNLTRPTIVILETIGTIIRAVQCPSDMIDQIGGWSTAGVGQSYGEGYRLNRKLDWLEECVETVN